VFALVRVDVHDHRHRDLPHVAAALHDGRLPPRAVQRRQQDPDQHRDDADDDQQLNEGECRDSA
jgi:hypothetical protein